MARLIIPDEPNFATFTATEQAVFPISFALFAKENLRVSVNGVELSQSDFTFSGALLTGGGYQGGSVTLNNAATGDVRIWRDIRQVRTTNYAPSNNVPVGSIDAALNRLTAQQQDIASVMDRVPQTAPGETPPTWEEVLTAAGLLGSNVGAIPVVPTGGDTAVPLAGWRGLVLPPEAFGAIAGVFTLLAGSSNKTALTKAANAGVILDGGGRTYALNGRWDAPASVQWRNIKFRQVATDGSAFNKTIVIDGFNDVRLEDVDIDLNGIVHVSSYSEAHGLKVANGARPFLNRVTVRNGTAMTGVWLEALTDLRGTDIEARDFSTNATGSIPTDDVMQGVYLANCVRPILLRCGGVNLTANWTGRPTPWRRFSRGIAWVGCSDFVIDTPYGHLVDQGVDITGSTGNTRGLVANIFAVDCSTYGWKLSNRNQYIQIRGFLVVRPGWQGGYIRSASADTGLLPIYCRIDGGAVYDPGASGLYTTSRAGIYVQAVTGSGYPAGMFIDNIDCIDTQTVKTMDHGFANDVPAQATTSTIPPNILGDGCRSFGHITAAQTGFFFPSAKATGTGSQAITNGTVNRLQITVDVYDPGNLVDTTNYRIVAKETGRYRVTAAVKFSNNATGRRELFLYKNGVETSTRDRARCAVNSATDDTILELNRTVNLTAGDYIEVFAYQNSGGSLNIDLANSWIDLDKIQTLY